MRAIVWIEKKALLLLHNISLAEHGGSSGLRDEGLLDSSLARPQNLAAYGEPDLAAFAASYGYRLANNHPFIDGNKRAAFLGIGLCLDLNGMVLDVDQPEAIATVLALAAGELGEDELAAWIRDHAVPVD
ncbi:type II toxin-antitoxin system death-on-curing family toxin [Enterovirga aerilata]|uniref:Type II toxin-antitoxin system death-on-curing family toxin n=1 Tax=Enterovirga aerilata TaxID=2730920 RepID=A0A849I440_9HYPH|nr:type II toxin-antitoxin system death-on-curing family toxin [Enterovirga sp. DB1703]